MLRAKEQAEILELHRLRLYYLERQLAVYGLHAEPSIIIERDIIAATIERLERQMQRQRHTGRQYRPVPARAKGLPHRQLPIAAWPSLEDAMKKILLVDNDLHYLESTGDYLESVGYQVLRAASLERARQLLDYTWVHVAIIDLRLGNDNDERDRSGLDLAKDSAYQVVPKIILTRYPSFDAVREALGPALRGIPPAVDFIDKRNTHPQALPDAIERALIAYERIQFALTISWNQPLSFPALIHLLLPDQDTVRLLDRCSELEDLLRKLFYESSQITVGRVLKHSAGRLALEVFAYSSAGAERQYVVVCGLKATIAEEQRRYKEVVPLAKGNHSTLQMLAAETLRFAASAYMLSGGDLEAIMPFRDFYQKKSIEMVVAGVNTLYADTLAAWHQQGREQLELPLGEALMGLFGLSGAQLTTAALRTRIEALGRNLLAANLVQEIDITPGALTLHFADAPALTYANPAEWLPERDLNPVLSVQRGIIHGGIDADTILVAEQGQPWLIDFVQAGRGVLLYDFIRLEAAIKFDVLDTLDLDLRHRLEARLLAASDLDAPLDDPADAPELRRALLTIASIRRNAANKAGVQLAAYEIGLCYSALALLASYQPELQYPRRRLVLYGHALLQLAMLCSKHTGSAASPADVPEAARTGFWLDHENEVAWVQGQRIELTAQEFQILAFLSQPPGTLHTRQQITDHILGIDYDIYEESWLNSAINRLRTKIEPDPRKPRYLITVRGRGYRLDLPS